MPNPYDHEAAEETREERQREMLARHMELLMAVAVREEREESK